MKKLLFIIYVLAAVSLHGDLQAQILTVSPGTDMTIMPGTIFSADSLILIPSAEFTLSNLQLQKNLVISHELSAPYIARVYQFSVPGAVFSGSVQINYRDGAELKGIADSTLKLNIYNGTNWNEYAPAARDADNNYLLTTGINAVALNELTLAGEYPPAKTNARRTLAAGGYIDAKAEYNDQLFNCKINPNPSSRYFSLEIQSVSNERVEVNLFDVGERLISKLNAAKDKRIRFGDDLRPGIYLVEIRQGVQRKTIKVIKH